VSFLTERGITGASVLEIGGGVGEIQIELLRRGATRATNLEISTNYEPEAVELLDRAGMRDRVDRRFLDIAQVPDEVEPVDIVVLHRVVCCYPDYQRLLAASGSKADRLLAFSHPPRNVATRTVLWWDNARRRLKGDSFRTFAHPPAAMLGVLSEAGLQGHLLVARVRVACGRTGTLTAAGQAGLAYALMPVSSSTHCSSPTVQASWPGSRFTTSPGPTVISLPSSNRMVICPDRQIPVW